MRTRILAICATIVMLGMLITPASVQAIADGDKGERLIATYGGYGIHYLTLGDYGRIMGRGTMGDALVDILFTGEKATGVIVLGEEEYKVELVKVKSDLVADGTSLVHKSIEGGILFEGYLLDKEGQVTLIRYQDVVVGEIDLGDVVYGFSVATSLLSAGTILVAHHDEYKEKLIELGMIELPELGVLGPPVIGPDPFDLPPPGFQEADRYICRESQYVPTLKQLLAAADSVIVLLLLTEPHLLEERIQELRELAALNDYVLRLIALYTLAHIEDEDTDIDDVHKLLKQVINAEASVAPYLESLAELIGPIWCSTEGGSSWRHVAVLAAPDEEYKVFHHPRWTTAIIDKLEGQADPRFKAEFQINFWIAAFYHWDTYPDGARTMLSLFREMQRDVNPQPFPTVPGDMVLGFTANPRVYREPWGLAEQGTTIWEWWTLGDYALIHNDPHRYRLADEVVWHELSHIFGCCCGAHHPTNCIMRVPNWTRATGWCTTGPNCRQVIAGNKWTRFR